MSKNIIINALAVTNCSSLHTSFIIISPPADKGIPITLFKPINNPIILKDILSLNGNKKIIRKILALNSKNKNIALPILNLSNTFDINGPKTIAGN